MGLAEGGQEKNSINGIKIFVVFREEEETAGTTATRVEESAG